MLTTARTIWILFATSVWVLIALCAYRIVIHILYANKIVGAYPGGYDFRVFIAPFILLSAELFLWFKMFRYPIHPARMFSAIVGLYIILMVIFVNLVVSDLYDRDINNIILFIYGYAALGHITYAVLGKEGNY